MKETLIGLSVAAIAFNLIPISPSQAQVIPDRTLPVNTVVNTSGTVHTITGGTQVGGNQFHSFDQFSVQTGNTAYFNNSPETANIISRVTGSSASDIDGLIKANGRANLFLVNPNGIIFGQNAKLDIGGSFTASTANSIKFSDGSEFSATNPSAIPLLTMSAPIGLQYGKTNPNTVLSNAGSLTVREGQGITLQGGSVSSTGVLTAPSGTVQLLGDLVSLLNNARIDVSGANGGGTVLIGGDYQGKGTVQNAQETYVDRGVTIDADALQNGNGGRVIVWADKSTEFYGSVTARGATLSSSVSGVSVSNGGFTEISGKQDLIFDGKVDLSALNGKLGTLLLDPTDVIISNGTTPGTTLTQASLQALANTANVQVTATNNITIGTLTGNTLTFAFGANSGSITFTADSDKDNVGSFLMNSTDTIRARGRNVSISGANISSGIIDTSNVTGIGGNIQLSALNGNISTGNVDSRGAANQRGGNVSISSAGNININGTLRSSQSTTGGSTTLLANGNINFGLYNGGSLRIFSGGSITSNNTITFTTNTSDTFNYSNVALWNGATLSLGGVTLSNGSSPNLSGTPSPVLLDARAGMLFQGSSVIATNANITLTNISTRQASRGLVLLSNQYSPNSLSGNVQVDNINTPAVNLNKGIDVMVDSRGNITTKDILAPSTAGNGGSVTLVARGNITTNGNISTQSTSANGGAINLLANGNIQFGNNSVISSNTDLNGNLSGRIDINSKGTVSGNGISIQSSSKNPSVVGRHGDVNITAQSLYLANGSQVVATINGGGNAGNLNIQIYGDAVFDRSLVSTSIEPNGNGVAGNLSINVGSLQLLNGSQLLAAVFGKGTGGNISIQADAIALDGFGVVTGRTVPTTISTSIELPTSSGTSGNINIIANTISLSDGAIITAYSNGKGNSGEVKITANSLNISSGGQIQTNTLSSGNAGNVSLFLRDLLQISGADSAIRVGTGPNSTGLSGSIFIDPLVVKITDGGRISASSLGTGNGGNIQLLAGSLFLDNNGIIRAESANGEGGNISLQIQDLLLLRHGSQISATAGNDGNGGNININTGFLVAVPYENSDISANADRGRGGNINVTAQAVYGIVFRPSLTPLSDFTVSSNFNLSGTVIINTPGIDPSKGLGNLPVDVGDASKLVPQRCLADRQGSEFIITGRGGVPANPSELVSGISLLDNLGTSNNSAAIASNPVEVKNEIPDTIVEAQGWVVSDRGQVTLVAKVPAAPASAWSTQPKCVSVAQK
ncbi:filamentous hemagglutinin N-terminal domain-containing protein [Tumidithrix elongata RA019]|uniref:Filamentous hemagglutinin N-terminal domain-containing protein n=1 Tax=Tumidithrix elongata BACA0141 TaxID=2716417 RepID=A0AAW9Q4M8_9CYAN|nr:filamentous hemagglutinin N-terminal domain-containing protein [Tumidithrix elongata RA019]